MCPYSHPTPAGVEPPVSHPRKGEEHAPQGADAVRGGGRLRRLRAVQDTAPAHAEDGLHHDAAPLPHAPGLRCDRECRGTHRAHVEGACQVSSRVLGFVTWLDRLGPVP